jgi:predicted RNA binding protein YcfA (HicA-like mRNA interferase family)
LPKLKILSGTELCRLLELNGFVNVRQRGSHRVMQRKTENGTVTVPVPMHDEIKIGTLLSIIRQTGLARTHFESE